MNINEKQKIVRRIVNRKLYGIVKYRQQEYEAVFSDPTLDLLCEADHLYDKMLKRLGSDPDSLTEERAISYLKEGGQWSDALEKELKDIDISVKDMNKELNNLKFNKSMQRAIKTKIQKAKDRGIELYRTKHQLRSSTVEYMADRAKRHFIIDNIVKVNAGSLADSPSFKDALAVYYFEESSIQESQYREIARSDPWRLYWSTAKDTGTSLFPHSLVEITDQQYILIFWTKTYDFAFESSNRPSEDIIADDQLFDAWQEAEISRLNSQSKKNELEGAFSGHSSNGYQEVFIPADAEGAKEVYALNNQVNRMKIKNKLETIKKVGTVKEQDLPDVKMDLQMQMNKLGMEAGTR